MTRQPFLFRLLAVALALCVVGISPHAAEAGAVYEINKDSSYASLFNVTANKEAAGIRVSVDVTKCNDHFTSYQLETVTYYADRDPLIRTNGTSLEFVIDEASFEKATVFVSYYIKGPRKDDIADIANDEVEVGGGLGFQLDISSLAAEAMNDEAENDEAKEDEPPTILGTWYMQGREGEVVPLDEMTRFIFEDNGVFQVFDEGVKEKPGTYTHDENKSQVTIYENDGSLDAIMVYSFVDDMFVMRISGERGNVQDKGYECTRNAEGTKLHQVLRTLPELG